jgi:hypothetical protein
VTTDPTAMSSSPRFRRFTKASRSAGKNEAHRSARKGARQNRRDPHPNGRLVSPTSGSPECARWTTIRLSSTRRAGATKSSFNQCGGAATEIDVEKKRSPVSPSWPLSRRETPGQGGSSADPLAGERFWPPMLRLTRPAPMDQLRRKEKRRWNAGRSREAAVHARSTSDRAGGHSGRSGHVPRVEGLESCRIPA